MHRIIKLMLDFSHNVIFPKQLAFGVFFLNLFGDKKYCAALKNRIEKCREGTVGCALNNFLEMHHFNLVPWYEKHDLKHVILGYSPSAEEEMCMQAFMFGNAGFRPMITLMTISFLIWTPDVWRKLPYHFLVGKLTAPIRHLKIEEVADLNLLELQQKIGLEKAKIKAGYLIQLLFSQNRNKVIVS